MELAGKTAVITGGASGIGLATAKRFAGAGREPRARRHRRGSARRGGQWPASATAPAAIGVSLRRDERRRRERASRRGARRVRRRARRLQQRRRRRRVQRSARPVSLAMGLDVNLDGVVYGINAFLPLFLEQNEGHVVNTASLAGLGGVSGHGPLLRGKVRRRRALRVALSRTGALGRQRRCLRVLSRVRAHAHPRVRAQHAQGSRELHGRPDGDRIIRELASQAVSAGIDASDVAEAVEGAVRANELLDPPARARRGAHDGTYVSSGCAADLADGFDLDAGDPALAVDAAGQLVDRPVEERDARCGTRSGRSCPRRSATRSTQRAARRRVLSSPCGDVGDQRRDARAKYSTSARSIADDRRGLLTRRPAQVDRLVVERRERRRALRRDARPCRRRRSSASCVIIALMKAPSCSLTAHAAAFAHECGQFSVVDDAGGDRVLEVVADVGDAVGPPDHLALGRRRRGSRPRVVADAVERLDAQS